MANTVPNPTLDFLLNTLIADDLTAQAFDSSHDYTTAAEFIDEVTTGSIGDPEVLADTILNGVVTVAADALDNIMSAEFVDALILYNDTGTPATSRIVGFYDRNGDGTDMNREGDGTPMALTFPGGVVLDISN